MKFTITAAAILALAAPSFAVTLSYDNIYDAKSTSLNEVACSDGSNGVENLGYTTFGSLPKWPYIGGAAQIAGYNSKSCGTCWQLTYTNTKGVKKSINILAIDHTDSGFNIAQAAMDDLTGGQAVHLGRVDVTSKQVNASVCGL